MRVTIRDTLGSKKALTVLQGELRKDNVQKKDKTFACKLRKLIPNEKTLGKVAEACRTAKAV